MDFRFTGASNSDWDTLANWESYNGMEWGAAAGFPGPGDSVSIEAAVSSGPAAPVSVDSLTLANVTFDGTTINITTNTLSVMTAATLNGGAFAITVNSQANITEGSNLNCAIVGNCNVIVDGSTVNQEIQVGGTVTIQNSSNLANGVSGTTIEITSGTTIGGTYDITGTRINVRDSVELSGVLTGDVHFYDSTKITPGTTFANDLYFHSVASIENTLMGVYGPSTLQLPALDVLGGGIQ